MIEAIKEALFRIFLFILLTIFIPVIFLWLAVDIILLDRDGKFVSRLINRCIKKRK